MKLENQVSSLELSKRLKALGVKQDGYFQWCYGADVDPGNEEEAISKRWELDKHDGALGMFSLYDSCSAFTCSELGEMLPNDFLSGRDGNEFVCCFNQNEERDVDQKFEDCFLDTWEDDREVNARAKMLIHLIESGLVKNTDKK